GSGQGWGLGTVGIVCRPAGVLLVWPVRGWSFGGEVEVGEGDVGGFADAQAAPAQEGDEEAFLQAAGAAEQGVVLGGAEPVVCDRLGFGRLDLAHRVGPGLAAWVGDQVEAVEVGVESPEGVDLSAVAG